jgi:two-component system invasion response regulator UvrY
MIPSPSRAVRVLTVDDQAVFRMAAREVIEATPGFEAVAEAGSGAEALTLTESLRPDLILMDVRMPGMGGVETSRRLHETRSEALVVLISFEDPADVDPVAQGCGAMACVRKQDFSPATLRKLSSS